MSGTTSLILGCSSGVHPEAFRRYIRHVQINNNEAVRGFFNGENERYLEKSHYADKRDIESVAAFNVEVPENALIQSDLTALEFLKLVETTQTNWIEEGTNFDHPSTKANPSMRMNVSNTITVDIHEWDEVAEYLWNHKENFCGVSFLPKGGDLIYKQAPMTSYLTAEEMVEKYGPGSLLASGLVVDGLEVFDNLWDACDAAVGINPKLLEWSDEDFKNFIMKNFKNGVFMAQIGGLKFSDINAVISHLKDKFELRKDWVRRFHQFAKNYHNGDVNICVQCLKHVNIFHKWHKVSRLKPIDWNSAKWRAEVKDAGTQMGMACSGGACLLDI